jgi:hypothetical protein
MKRIVLLLFSSGFTVAAAQPQSDVDMTLRIEVLL